MLDKSLILSGRHCERGTSEAISNTTMLKIASFLAMTSGIIISLFNLFNIS